MVRAILEEMNDFRLHKQEHCYVRNPYGLIFSNLEYNREEQIKRLAPFSVLILIDERLQTCMKMGFTNKKFLKKRSSK